MPVAEERLAPIRQYLAQAFPDWELADQWDGNREAHTFRLEKHREPIHLLKVSRELLDDNQPAEIAAIIAGRGVADALRQFPTHRLLLTTRGLSDLGPA